MTGNEFRSYENKASERFRRNVMKTTRDVNHIRMRDIHTKKNFSETAIRRKSG